MDLFILFANDYTLTRDIVLHSKSSSSFHQRFGNMQKATTLSILTLNINVSICAYSIKKNQPPNPSYRFVNDKCGVNLVGPFLQVFHAPLGLGVDTRHLVEQQGGRVVIHKHVV